MTDEPVNNFIIQLNSEEVLNEERRALITTVAGVCAAHYKEMERIGLNNISEDDHAQFVFDAAFLHLWHWALARGFEPHVKGVIVQ